MNQEMRAYLETLGADFGVEQSGSRVLHFGDAKTEYSAAREEAVVVDRSNRGKLTFRGEDRVSFLHGMLTNTVEGLSPGTGNHSALTDVKGNTQADMWVFNTGDTIRIETEPGVQQKVSSFLDRYIIADDVEIVDETEDLHIVGIQGPKALRVVQDLVVASIDLEMNGNVIPEDDGSVRMVGRRSYTGEDGFDLWVPSDKAPDVYRLAVEAGAVPAGEEALEGLRIESGIPKYGTDVDDRVVPLEGGIRDTVDFTKGCFIGQEVLGKMQNIGKPRRFLVGLFTEGLLDPETELISGDKVVGSVRSGVESVALGRSISLGSVRRGFEEPGMRIDVADGEQVEVTALPFVVGKSLTVSDLNLSA